jgi:hypothetical protein
MGLRVGGEWIKVMDCEKYYNKMYKYGKFSYYKGWTTGIHLATGAGIFPFAICTDRISVTPNLQHSGMGAFS